MSEHLAIDLGASSGRVIIGSTHQGRLEIETVHRFENGPVRMGNALVWDTVKLWSDILQGLSIAAKQSGTIRSIGVDTWGVDYVLLDPDDQMLGQSYSHRDERTRGILDRAYQLVPKNEIFSATGVQFMEMNTGYQLLSQSLAHSPMIHGADALLMMGDFFHWLLTGKRSIEATNASTTQLLDPYTGTWALDLISRLGLPAKIFMPTIEPGTNLGPVQDWVGRATGLSGVPVIVPPTHDTASAIVAVPATDFSPVRPDWCYISSGTWSLMGCELPRPIINETVAALNFTNERGVMGSTRLLKNICGLWIFQQIRASMIRRGNAITWPQMVELAEAAPAHSLLLDPDSPDFTAPLDMVWAIEQYAVRTGQSVPASDGVVYRAALEGLALRYRHCLGSLESILRNRIETIHIVGGGAMNTLLCQMTADACDRIVIAGPVEATAIGNLLIQMCGLGLLQSVDEARAMVRASFSPVIYHPQRPERWVDAAKRFESL